MARMARILALLSVAVISCGGGGGQGSAGSSGRTGTPPNHGDGEGGSPPATADGGAGRAGGGGSGGSGAGSGAGGAGSGGQAAANVCAQADAMPPIAMGVQGGFLPQGGSERGSCGGPGGEVAYRVVVDRALAALDVEPVVPPTAPDVTIYVRRACTDAGSELGCATGAGARVTVPAPAMGTYYVFVDGGASASFQVRVRQRLADGQACDPSSTQVICSAGSVCGVRGGATMCARALCADGMDNDTDGTGDYPADPGCDSPEDDDEADPATRPTCADGMDNDGDGLSDWPMDPGCMAASDADEADVCVPGLPIATLPADGVAMGDVTNLPNLLTGSCGAPIPIFGTGEVVYRVRLPDGVARLDAKLDPAFIGAMIYIERERCGDPMAEVACAPDGMMGASVQAPAAGSYFIVVDGIAFPGAFSLHVTGTLGMGAACDPMRPMLQCPMGQTCTGGRCG